jgi:hypothetical protein
MGNNGFSLDAGDAYACNGAWNVVVTVDGHELECFIKKLSDGQYRAYAFDTRQHLEGTDDEYLTGCIKKIAEAWRDEITDKGR